MVSQSAGSEAPPGVWSQHSERIVLDCTAADRRAEAGALASSSFRPLVANIE